MLYMLSPRAEFIFTNKMYESDDFLNIFSVCTFMTVILNAGCIKLCPAVFVSLKSGN